MSRLRSATTPALNKPIHQVRLPRAVGGAAVIRYRQPCALAELRSSCRPGVGEGSSGTFCDGKAAGSTAEPIRAVPTTS